MLDSTLLVSVVIVLLLINAAGVILTALQLPGNWLILLATAVVAWWGWPEVMGWIPLIALLGLAILGEVIEFLGGMLGSTTAGGSKRAAGLALVIGILGAIAGTFFIPVPILGTLIGAAIGAGVGSMGGELWAGQSLRPALRVGQGAALGRLLGAAGKLAVGAAMWLVAAVPAIWP